MSWDHRLNSIIVIPFHDLFLTRIWSQECLLDQLDHLLRVVKFCDCGNLHVLEGSSRSFKLNSVTCLIDNIVDSSPDRRHSEISERSNGVSFQYKIVKIFTSLDFDKKFHACQEY